MNANAARSADAHDLAGSAADDAVARAFGVTAAVVCRAEVLADQALFVLEVDHDAHVRRRETGAGPEVDGRVLAMWEWPESGSFAPAPPLRVEAIVVRANRWRTGLQRARRWSGFAPAGLVTRVLARSAAEECTLECRLRDVGLVISDDIDGDDDLEQRVPLPLMRSSPGARRTADRWLEETLYQQILTQQLLD